MSFPVIRNSYHYVADRDFRDALSAYPRLEKPFECPEILHWFREVPLPPLENWEPVREEGELTDSDDSETNVLKDSNKEYSRDDEFSGPLSRREKLPGGRID